jgi:hypothetical protein
MNGKNSWEAEKASLYQETPGKNNLSDNLILDLWFLEL